MPNAFRRSAFSFLLAGALASCQATDDADPAKTPRRPNILVVMADDLADWHLGCYGNTEIRTPHIDRLASEGVRMGNAFVCTPICSPSRATFFTGRVPRQHGIQDFLTGKASTEDPPQGWPAPPASFADEVMISDLLAEAGYRCGYLGKWHMGGDDRPQHRYSVWRTGGGGAYVDPVLQNGTERVKEKGYTPEILTRHAQDFIRAERSTGRPWLLVVSYPNPHLPYEGHPQKYYDLYKDATFASFGIEPKAANCLREASFMDDPITHLRKAAAATTALDDQIPPLLETLDATGQRVKTLVLFTGDHGFLYGRHGAWSKAYATNPPNLWEEVVRVPLIVSWPGVVPGKRVLPQFVSFYDVLPTLADAGGVPRARMEKLRRERNLPGRSYWPLLMGETVPWEDVAYFHFRNTEGIRDVRHKLVLRNDGKGPNELYDLEADPREKTNRADDPALAETRKGLEARLRKWRAEHDEGR